MTRSKNKSQPSKGELDVLSSDFLSFYHDGSYPLISTRDDLSKAFLDFMKTKQQQQEYNLKTLRQTESFVMSRMRQRKWMKVKRGGGSGGPEQQLVKAVLVVQMVGRDRLTFPDVKEVQTVRDLLRAQALEVERDKAGVTLQVVQDGIVKDNPLALSTAVGKASIIAFRLMLSPDAGLYTRVTVDSVELRGPHAHRLRAHGPETVSKLGRLPLSFGRDPFVVEYMLDPPRSIGLMRIRFHVSFEKDDAAFEICRNLLISSGNPAIVAALEPTSPYQPRKYKHRIGPKNQVVHWPEESKPARKGQVGDLPLRNYSIPKETRWVLENKEFSALLDAFDWSPKTTEVTRGDDADDEFFKSDVDDYGKFWSQLLFASEHQSLIDIQMFDLENVKMQRAPHHMFALTVPGLAEGRPSVLRGDLINMTWKQQLFKGRVHSTQLLQVILQVPLAFSQSFNPSVDRVDMVRFTFSRMTYRTSHQACLDYASQYLGPKILEPTLPMIEAYRATVPPMIPKVLSFANRNLNPEQQQAIYRIVQGKGGAELPYILFGPPGTGKTTVVVETVYQLASRRVLNHQRRPRILLVAPSNDASDILVQRLSQYFPPKELLRVLAYSRRLDDVSPALRPYTIQLGEELILEEIAAARIVVSTVNLASRLAYMGVKRGHFDCVMVDEAGHATEPELIAVAASLMDMKAAGSECQLILAGDPKQLGPITTSKICESFGYGISLLERLSQRKVYRKDPRSHAYPHDLVTKLVRNYRSHPALLKLPNDLYYDGELQNCGDVFVTHSLCRWEHLPKAGFPLLFHSINGRNLREGNSPSWFNPEEAQQVAGYVDLLTRESRPPTAYEDIGIITPYARQAQKIRAALEISHPGNSIKVGSVETFQGQERRVIILSTVRSDPDLFFDHDAKYNLGFVAHPKRFNVAMTRAKALMIVVGCPSVLALDRDNWLPLLMYCHDQNAWAGDEWDPHSADERDGDGEGGDEIAVMRSDGAHKLSQESWDVVQVEEVFGYVNREE